MLSAWDLVYKHSEPTLQVRWCLPSQLVQFFVRAQLQQHAMTMLAVSQLPFSPH